MGRNPTDPINPFFGAAVQAATSTGKGSSQVKDLAGNHVAVRHVGTQCGRAKRTLSSSTQEEIDSLFNDTDFSLFEELNMEYFRNSKRPVERCSCDGGIDNGNVHDVVRVRGFTRSSIAQNVIQEFLSMGTDPSIQMKRSLFFSCWTSLRCSWSGRQAGGVMTKLIERNTAIHTKRGQHITTYADNQPDVPTPSV